MSAPANLDDARYSRYWLTCDKESSQKVDFIRDTDAPVMERDVTAGDMAWGILICKHTFNKDGLIIASEEFDSLEVLINNGAENPAYFDFDTEAWWNKENPDLLALIREKGLPREQAVKLIAEFAERHRGLSYPLISDFAAYDIGTLWATGPGTQSFFRELGVPWPRETVCLQSLCTAIATLNGWGQIGEDVSQARIMEKAGLEVAKGDHSPLNDCRAIMKNAVSIHNYLVNKRSEFAALKA